MRAILVLAFVAVVACTTSAGERGLVGITIDGEHDFRTITAVVPGSPAAEAGVHVGDRIRAIDGISTSRLHTAQELLSRARGAPGTQVELERAGAAQPVRVRIQRVALPDHTTPPKILPDGSGYQA